MIDLLIVDDDVQWTSLLASVAEQLGLSCEVLHDGAQALKEVGRLKPRVLVLDIMMPGMDGLSLCQALKANPANAPLKIVIASNKPFKDEVDEARRCGAEAFFRKTASVAGLGRQIEKWARSQGGEQAVEDLAGKPLGRVPVFRVRVWGSRGAGGAGSAAGTGVVPALTSCVSVEYGPRLLILDAGSGLGGFFDTKPTPEAGLWALLTHYHEDHISGLHHLREMKDTQVSVAGPQDTRHSLDSVLQRALTPELAARINALRLPESGFKLQPGLNVRCLLTRHPGPTLAFRLEYQGRSIVYCPDNEIEAEGEKSDYSVKLVEFARGADLLIHDARYLDEDYPAHHLEGHSSVGGAVALARDAGARRLMLFHMDARYPAQRLEQALRRAREALAAAFSPLLVDMASPGTYLDV